MNIRWRKAGATDADEVAAVGRQTFDETWGPFYSPEDMREYLSGAFDIDLIRSQLEDVFHTSFYLFYADGQAAGYFKLSTGSENFKIEGQKAGDIERFYFFKRYHGSGLADRAMEVALQELKEKGCDWASLGVDVNNHRAIRFYAKYGFVVYGKKDFVVGSVVDTDQLMKRPLSDINRRNPSA
jgi:ribosomal protein S18 acetylase RimI-like enzyme